MIMDFADSIVPTRAPYRLRKDRTAVIPAIRLTTLEPVPDTLAFIPGKRSLEQAFKERVGCLGASLKWSQYAPETVYEGKCRQYHPITVNPIALMSGAVLCEECWYRP